jgi:hypothetical protein
MHVAEKELYRNVVLILEQTGIAEVREGQRLYTNAEYCNTCGEFAHCGRVKRVGTMVICVTASLGNAPSEWMGM